VFPTYGLPQFLSFTLDLEYVAQLDEDTISVLTFTLEALSTMPPPHYDFLIKVRATTALETHLTFMASSSYLLVTLVNEV
jgi:hypothetical protein